MYQLVNPPVLWHFKTCLDSMPPLPGPYTRKQQTHAYAGHPKHIADEKTGLLGKVGWIGGLNHNLGAGKD